MPHEFPVAADNSQYDADSRSIPGVGRALLGGDVLRLLRTGLLDRNRGVGDRICAFWANLRCGQLPSSGGPPLRGSEGGQHRGAAGVTRRLAVCESRDFRVCMAQPCFHSATGVRDASASSA